MPADPKPTLVYPFDRPADGGHVEVAPGVFWVRLPLVQEAAEV